MSLPPLPDGAGVTAAAGSLSSAPDTTYRVVTAAAPAPDGSTSEFSACPPVAPAVPLTADDCRAGGWQNYPHLGVRNQGSRVAYVNARGRAG